RTADMPGGLFWRRERVRMESRWNTTMRRAMPLTPGKRFAQASGLWRVLRPGPMRILKGFVETQVETKGCGNVSEDVRGLHRDAQEREADRRLAALLLESLTTPDQR